MPSCGCASMKRMFAASVPTLTQIGWLVCGSQVGPPVEWMTTMSIGSVRAGPVRRASAPLAATASSAAQPAASGLSEFIRRPGAASADADRHVVGVVNRLVDHFHSQRVVADSHVDAGGAATDAALAGEVRRKLHVARNHESPGATAAPFAAIGTWN